MMPQKRAELDLKEVVVRGLSWLFGGGRRRDTADKTKRAQKRLEEELVGALGRGLPGITGYGARWDDNVGGMALGVFVDKPEAAATVRRKLPPRIEDLPVRVISRSRARAQPA
jgi:hypothetical protein